jgi:hypothetical protein
LFFGLLGAGNGHQAQEEGYTRQEALRHWRSSNLKKLIIFCVWHGRLA